MLIAPALDLPRALQCGGYAPPDLLTYSHPYQLWLPGPYSPPDLSALALEFEGCAETPVVDLVGLYQATLPAARASLAAHGLAVWVRLGAVQAALPVTRAQLGATAVALIDLELPSDTPNGYPASTRTRQQQPSASEGYRLRHTDGIHAHRRGGLMQTDAVPITSSLTTPQAEMLRLSGFASLLATDGIRISARTDTTQTETIRQRCSVQFRETETRRITASTCTPHAERIYTRTWCRFSEQEARGTTDRLCVLHQGGLATELLLCLQQTDAMWPLPGRWVPCYETPSILAFRLDCRNPAPPELPSVIELPLCCAPRRREPWVSEQPPPHGTIVIPIRRVYHVLNNVSLVRLSDNQPLDVERLSLSLSADAWTWSWSATMPGAMLDLIRVAGEPQELLATINGESIRLRIDSISRSRSFGASSLSVSGRGRAAVLASPAAPMLNFSNSEVRTAQQLLIDALTDNGVPIGWSVDWQIEDWSVPAGAWSLAGTYIDAAKRIAEAGGGYVQGHDTDPTLIIRAYYPVAPWDWPTTTPDIILPEDVCRTEAIEWREKVAYDAVWVTGNVGGRRDRIRRAGMSGDTQAPTVVDDLATDVIMTRQRGIRVLGDTGRQAWVSVSLPVIEETGLIRPGQLIRYSEQGNTHLGLSRSLSVECTFPAVWQTIQLETHP